MKGNTESDITYFRAKTLLFLPNFEKEGIG